MTTTCAELRSALESFRAQPYSLEADTERELAGESITEHAATSVIALYPHQRAAAFAIRLAWDAGYPGFLLADDVGLGKTITALLAALDVEKTVDSDPMLPESPWYRRLTSTMQGAVSLIQP